VIVRVSEGRPVRHLRPVRPPSPTRALATDRSPAERGRDAFARRAWEGAHEALGAARRAGPLGTDDLWRLAIAAYLIGDVADFEEALEEAHGALAGVGETTGAVRSAFWLGLHFANSDEPTRASGWFGRAARLADVGTDGVERGYVLVPTGHRQLVTGAFGDAARTASEAVAVGVRHGDRDLVTLALHLEGRALLRLGSIELGLSRLDEAMVGVEAEGVSPVVTGLVYCSAIGACREVLALRRVRDWTESLAEWCDAQPDVVAYTGDCRAFRAEWLLHRGEWAAAAAEARESVRRFERGPRPNGVGLAHYQEAEAHRLLGAYAAAEAAYGRASAAGHEPQPGLALLRLAQGDAVAAAAAIGRALAERTEAWWRARLLPAYVEVLVGLGEHEAARRAYDELVELRGACAPDVIGTVLAHALGAIELAARNPELALRPLRAACSEWRAIGSRYECARARLLMGHAYRAVGDEDGAKLELAAARAELAGMGAPADAFGDEPKARHGLTPRELEVLALVATGRTNRVIAEDLSVSDKTVARHVANIFAKLGVNSRAAATAYAYDHGLR
jgi:DNA-binding CsgD family transcriptional regulator